MPSIEHFPPPTEVIAAAATTRDGAAPDHDDSERGREANEPGGEQQPLLSQRAAPGEETRDDDGGGGDGGEWKAPRHFLLIEVAIFANVFLYGLDSTITAATYAVIASEFDAVNTASWLTTSYLVTSTAFQPLYGRISDIFGRRVCFFISTVTFALGCLGCGVARDFVLLNLMRALTGFGGGGLMTMGEFELG
jgi:hypothetical protein